jgi:hypothetical protein
MQYCPVELLPRAPASWKIINSSNFNSMHYAMLLAVNLGKSDHQLRKEEMMMVVRVDRLGSSADCVEREITLPKSKDERSTEKGHATQRLNERSTPSLGDQAICQCADPRALAK